MNAHAIIAAGSAGGRPALDEQVLAVQQGDLLQYLAAPAPASEIGAIAQALGKDPSNLRKSLQRLEREGLVSAKPIAITDKGRSWIPRLAALQGSPIAAGLPPLTWLQLRENPDNPRTDLDTPEEQAETARLAENIARRGLKTPVSVQLDADGAGGMVAMGARRFRAIGLLIAKGDPRWPADKPVPYVVNDNTDGAEVLADALVENIQRRDMHPLDEAAGYARLKNDYGWTPAQILEECGVERRLYEQRLDLLNLTDAQQARMRLPKDDPNYLSTKGARGLLQHLRQLKTQPAEPTSQLDLEARALAFTPKLELALVEVAFAIEQKPGREPVKLTGWPEGGALATLRERGHVQITGGLGSGFTIAIPKTEAAIAAWLTDKGFYDDPASIVFKAREAVLGPAAAKRLADEKVYATDELNTDPMVVGGRRFYNATRASEARRALTGERTPMNSGGAPKSKAAEPEPQDIKLLDRHQELRLLELAAKIEADRVSVVGIDFGATRVGSYWLDGKLDRLVQELKYVAFKNPGGPDGWLGYLTPDGWIAVGEIRGALTLDQAVERARNACGQAGWPGPDYVTAWLNVEPAAELVDADAAADSHDQVADDQDVEEAKAAELLSSLRVALAATSVPVSLGAQARSVLQLFMREAGLIGPFVAGEGDDAGQVLGADGGAAAPIVCDVNSELPHARAIAQAELVAFALNAVAGHSHTTTEA